MENNQEYYDSLIRAADNAYEYMQHPTAISAALTDYWHGACYAYEQAALMYAFHCVEHGLYINAKRSVKQEEYHQSILDEYTNEKNDIDEQHEDDI